MKKLLLAMCLVLVFGAAASAGSVKIGSSSTVSVSGSNTWTNGVLTNPSSVTEGDLAVTVSASGDGWSGSAKLGNIYNQLSATEYKFKTENELFTLNVWGKGSSLSDIKTPFEFVTVAKKESGNFRFRLDAKNDLVPTTFDISSGGQWTVFASKELGAATVGTAVQMPADRSAHKGEYDVWAKAGLGIADLSSEFSLNKPNANSQDTSLAVKAAADLTGSLSATAQLKNYVNNAKKSKNIITVTANESGLGVNTKVELTDDQQGSSKKTYLWAKQTDLAVAADVTLTQSTTDADDKTTALSATRDTDLSYLKGTWKNENKADKTTVTANAMFRGSKDNRWDDVFDVNYSDWFTVETKDNGKNGWQTSKTWVAGASFSTVKDTTASPKNTIEVNGVYNEIANLKALAKFSMVTDNDNANPTTTDLLVTGVYVVSSDYSVAPIFTMNNNGTVTTTEVGVNSRYTGLPKTHLDAGYWIDSASDQAQSVQKITVGFGLSF